VVIKKKENSMKVMNISFLTILLFTGIAHAQIIGNAIQGTRDVAVGAVDTATDVAAYPFDERRNYSTYHHDGRGRRYQNERTGRRPWRRDRVAYNE
jgi:hypothetical protein